jgi:ribokinase
VKSRILVVGSSNVDMIARVPRIPRPGETILGGEFITAAGGKGANQAVAAARAGGDVTFIARVGKDMFGDRSLAGFQRDRINVKYVRRDPRRPSGIALIFVSHSGQNSIAVAPGANAQLSPSDVHRGRTEFERAAVLLAQLEIPLRTVMTALRLAARNRVLTIVNPAPAQRLPEELLRHVSIITPNESEAELMTGIKVTSEVTGMRAAAKLRARGVPTVIITLGAKGALVVNWDGGTLVPGFKVKPVDTTAAGDVFNGALSVALAEGLELRAAVLFANAAAAISVTRMGAQPSAPRRKEIAKLLTQHGQKSTTGGQSLHQ